uniref:Uncharacterized protein n=1 Tax=viral metagenome TaxID=1070528 RepID=A0A6C0B7P3_9ZZZZ
MVGGSRNMGLITYIVRPECMDIVNKYYDICPFCNE